MVKFTDIKVKKKKKKSDGKCCQGEVWRVNEVSRLHDD